MLNFLKPFDCTIAERRRSWGCWARETPASSDPDMYDGALFSYEGDFQDYLGLDGMGTFTVQACDPGVPESKLEEIRHFGKTLA